MKLEVSKNEATESEGEREGEREKEKERERNRERERERERERKKERKKERKREIKKKEKSSSIKIFIETGLNLLSKGQILMIEIKGFEEVLQEMQKYFVTQK